MKYIVAYTLISFIAIGVLGFSGLINHESLFSQCVSATIPGGMPCSELPHSFQMNVLHAQIFQSFTFALLVAAIALAVALMAIALSLMQIRLPLAAQQVDAIKESGTWHKYTRWMALYQQHPGHA